MESVTIDEWRPAEFVVVAQLDIERPRLEDLGVSVFLEDGEETAYVRLSSGNVYALFKMPENPIPGYALLCGDPDGLSWLDALDAFMDEVGLDRSIVIWVPDDESESG